MKKVFFYFMVFILICSLLSSCSEKVNFPYADIKTPIKTVELLHYPWYADRNSGEMGSFDLIDYLEDDEIASFMEAVCSLLVYEVKFGDPPVNFGEYIARVSYEDGRVLYLGTDHIELVEPGETPNAAGEYAFVGEAFDELFSYYLG